MGNFFTSTQIYSSDAAERDKFIDTFCKAMEKEGYVTCECDEAEKSYILKFADNCKWVTITSEEYEHDYKLSQSDTGFIASMLDTVCIKTSVADSDYASLDLYDESGNMKGSIIMGLADEYYGGNIPKPSENVWTPLIETGYSWKQLLDVCNGEYVFVEEGLIALAPILGIDTSNILFCADDANENNNSTVILDFKKARPAIVMSMGGKETNSPKKPRTLNAAFKEIVGKALEPFGFKFIKGRHPYIVRVINNEILHIITFCPEQPNYPEDKAFSIMGGVATIYRKKIDFELSPKRNHVWFDSIGGFYYALPHDNTSKFLERYDRYCYYSDKPDSLISAVTFGAEDIIKCILPIMDKINDVDSCLDYMNEFKMPCNPRQCEKICTYYPDEDEAFLYFMSESWQDKQPEFLNEFINNSGFHEWVTAELERRKAENLEILKGYGIISD